ncbi:MAG TPA: L-fucokinase, partial [Spirochaetia bacterium]|nr:L-fucokinase [Spirochaetia bacterium]
MNLFSYCIITASDAAQAESFRRLIDRRIEHGLYPREISFRVYPDPEGGRIGSGGGTLWALQRLVTDIAPNDPKSFLASSRILIIHAGGESRRLPCYAPEGKLFAPVPVASSSVIPPVVLDLDLSLFLKYPWRDGETVVASGDVIIDFDTDAVVMPGTPLCGFAKPAPFSQGARHGVFRFDAQGVEVLEYYQKQSEAFLARHARLEGTDQCALDLGIVSMRGDFACDLLDFGRASLASGRSVIDSLAAGSFRFDLYLELLTSCLGAIDRDTYLTRMRGASSATDADLRLIFDRFHGQRLGGILTRSTEFLHFGSLSEFPTASRTLAESRTKLFYAPRDPEIFPEVRPGLVIYNSQDVRVSVVPAAAPVVVEGCASVTLENCGGGQLFTGLDERFDFAGVPAGISVDVRRLHDGEKDVAVAMVFSDTDSFRVVSTFSELVFCRTSFPIWLEERGLTIADIECSVLDLLDIPLFVASADPEFVCGYWSSPTDSASWKTTFLSSKRYSVREINRLTDASIREEERTTSRAKILREHGLAGNGWRSMSAADFRGAFEFSDRVALEKMLARTDDQLLRLYRSQLLQSLPRGAGGGEQPETSESPVISFVSSGEREGALRRRVKEDQIVWARAPVRLDLAGGWTDTPPYTNRFGGTVTNVAVNLNGQPPIQVFVRPTPELHIRIHSIDLGVTETLTTSAALRDFRNPTSPFALPKAALCLLGLAPEDQPDQENLAKRLGEIGSGLEITLLCAVPKGSGLGTSSVLGGVILGALERFFRIETTREKLFLKVLEMEQMLTTGGGWQDQIGGIVGGIKYIESRSGLRPDPAIQQLDSYLFE